MRLLIREVLDEKFKNFKVKCQCCNTMFLLGTHDDPYCEKCRQPGVVKDHPDA